MTPIPYLFFKDGCREAMEFYARTFGSAPPEVMSFGDLPPDEREKMPGVPGDAVMHASIKVGDGMIFASDDPSGGAKAMEGCNVHMSMPTLEKAREVFDALCEGGEVRMPLEPTFWSPGFGALTDRWGIRWMIDVEAPAPT